MVYRSGAMVALESGSYDWRIVSEAEWPQAQADGWHLDQYAAKAAHEATLLDQSAPAVDESAPPTRAEMEQKATELGIKFDARMGDKKLAAKIAEALGSA